MRVRIHNTPTRRTELVQDAASLAPIRFCSCGPNVHGDAHIGNFRSFLNADVPSRRRVWLWLQSWMVDLRESVGVVVTAV